MFTFEMGPCEGAVIRLRVPFSRDRLVHQISATAGITRITEEHIGLLLALDMPLFAVLNKCELAPGAVGPLLVRLARLLEPANKVASSKQACLSRSVHYATRWRHQYPASCCISRSPTLVIPS
ncbi:jg22558 [Pararge aegeria aegeria]|uniref:Jg22558 protein n=1 Tax=Pararge aegeria aegeria TaxID=348720 RepID=A0A8S4QCJ2_9NEOP|nr:jg22558 [Pararge aegeria aegeria]